MESHVPISPPALSLSSPTQPLAPEKEFILTLETLPILWDKTHTNYVNKYKRNEALEKLLVIYKLIKPGANVQDVKNKINTLRCNYRRELKKIVTSKRSGAGADEVYIPKGWAFEYLSFLDKFEKPVTQFNSIDDSHDSDRSQPGQQETQSQDTSLAHNTGGISSATAIPPPTKPSTKFNKGVLAKQNELLDRACKYLAEPIQNAGTSIAFEWAESLNRLEPTQRLFAKKAINDILFEAELGTLNRYSVKINDQAGSTTTPQTQDDEYTTYTAGALFANFKE